MRPLDPLWVAHLVSVSILFAMLSVVAVTYLAVAVGVAGLGRVHPRAAARPIGVGLLFAVLALTAYVFSSTYLRHDPPGPGGEDRPLDAYVPTARALFAAIHVVAPLLAGWVAAAAARRRRLGAAFAAAFGVVPFLVLVLPISDFANACFMGGPFVLTGIRC